MLSSHLFPRRRWMKRVLGRPPRVLALFSFRYDADLVPDLIENLRPIVDGYVAYDDRAATELFSDEPRRRRELVAAARQMGARWVIFIDPDERLEAALAGRIHELTRAKGRIAWGFHFRELYAPDAYRVDGYWRKKMRYTLFPLLEKQRFDAAALHGPHHPKGYRRRDSGLNVYHLKMITAERRAARRDLYKALDPGNSFQAIGYDYLADDDGAVLKRIPRGREYRPLHRDDGGLWMPPVARTEEATAPAPSPHPLTSDRDAGHASGAKTRRT